MGERADLSRADFRQRRWLFANGELGIGKAKGPKGGAIHDQRANRKSVVEGGMRLA